MKPRSRRSLILLGLFLGVSVFFGGLWLWRQIENPVTAPSAAGKERPSGDERPMIAEGRVARPEPGDRDDERIELGRDTDAGWVVRGEVREGSRKKEPWPGAKLVAEVFPGYATTGEAELRTELVSDKDGKICWPMPRPDHTVTLRFRSTDPKLLIFSRHQEHLVVRGRPAPQDLVIVVQPLLCRVSGLVVDQQDRPIAKARVFCRRSPILTDDGGRFEAETPAWSFYHFCVIADGYGIEYTSVQLDGPGCQARITIKLKVALRVAGRVLDEGGRPIGGAKVSSMLSRSRHHVLSDADGMYEVSWLGAGATRHTLFVDKAGYASVRRGIDLNNPEDSYDVVLHRGTRIEGTVYGPDRQPVAGALIRLGEHSPTKLRGLSNDEGRFVLEHVPAGQHQFATEAEGFAVHARIIEVPKSRKDFRLDVFLENSQTLVGTVVDRSDQPIAGVQVGVWITPSKLGLTQVTNAAGCFRLEGLAPGNAKLSCFKRGYLRREVEASVHDPNLRIVLDQAAFTAGRVIDGTTGQPVTAYRIFEIMPELKEGERKGSSLGFGDAGKDVKNEDGVWRSLYPCTPDSVTGVMVIAKGYAPGTHQRIRMTVKPDPEMNVLELFPGATIRGTVHDDSGAPIANATIHATGSHRPLHPHHFRPSRATTSTQTDKDGIFVLQDAPTGNVFLYIRHASYPTTVDGPFTAILGQTANRQVLVPRSAVVFGTLTGLDGKPVGGVDLRLIPKRVPGVGTYVSWKQSTDPSGRFRFDTRLAAGEYELRVAFADPRLRNTMVHASVTVERAGSHQVDLAPIGKCKLEITILWRLDTKLSYVNIAKQTTGGKADPKLPALWLTAKRGRVVARGLSPGLYRVKANDDSGKSEVLVQVREGRRNRVELALQK